MSDENPIENDDEFVRLRDGQREIIVSRKELRTFALRVSRIMATASPVLIPPHINKADTRKYEKQFLAPISCLRKDLVEPK